MRNLRFFGVEDHSSYIAFCEPFYRCSVTFNKLETSFGGRESRDSFKKRIVMELSKRRPIVISGVEGLELSIYFLRKDGFYMPAVYQWLFYPR